METKAVCAFGVSACSTLVSFFTEWMPVLQGVAVIVAILSGVFAIAVSVKKLLEKP